LSGARRGEARGDIVFALAPSMRLLRCPGTQDTALSDGCANSDRGSKEGLIYRSAGMAQRGSALQPAREAFRLRRHARKTLSSAERTPCIVGRRSLTFR